ncbi:MAG TPA: polyprenyl synthetase family protein [Pseudonocardia sp.]|nr:polyprenyl synthetase family protein [Pseudonocardia sp.]
MTRGAVHDTRQDGLDRELTTAVETELAAYLAGRRSAAAELDPLFGQATWSLDAFVMGGGKRLRPTFAWWGWRGAGGDPETPEATSVVRAIGALELIQACALIHDDLMDASSTRRGKPTVHVEFAARHRTAGWRGQPEQFGTAVAILLGDLALSWADDLLRGSGLGAEALRRVAEPWDAMRTEVLGGPFLDVLHQATGDPTEHAALQIDRFKTAAYTVERPLHLGAAIAGAGPELVNAYRRFGIDVGVAFQLRDDLLGVFGDPAVTGKPAGDDLREGKCTLLLACATQRAEAAGDGAALTELARTVGNPELVPDELDRMRELLTELGAVRAVERRITELTESGLAALAGVPIAEPAGDRLAELAVAATRRAR